MKALLALCLWLTALAALADPVPLFTPGPPLSASDPIYQGYESKQPNFVRVQSIVLNPAAYGADIVTVELNGKLDTFQMRPTTIGGRQSNAWDGEEDDEEYDQPARLFLSKRMKSGEVSGELTAYLTFPPRTTFMTRNRSEGPTLLLEQHEDLEAHLRSPFWRIWVILLVVGSLFTYGASMASKRATATQDSAKRFALTDAAICCGTFLLGTFISQCLRPEADWNPDHLDTMKVIAILFAAAVGAGLVYWRVLAAYRTGAVSIQRAAGEGVLGAALTFVAIFALACAFGAYQGWGSPLETWPYLDQRDIWRQYVKPGLQVMTIGAAVGAILWAINRYVLPSVSGAPVSPNAMSSAGPN